MVDCLTYESRLLKTHFKKGKKLGMCCLPYLFTVITFAFVKKAKGKKAQSKMLVESTF